MLYGALGELALGELPDEGISNAGGIASAEAFGVAIISGNVAIIGAGNIASAEAFGIPDLVGVFGAGNIVSAEAFGTPDVILVVAPGSIASAEAFGVAAIYELFTYEPVSKL